MITETECTDVDEVPDGVDVSDCSEDDIVTREDRCRRIGGRWRWIVVACLLIIAACVASALYVTSYRHDRAEADATDPVIDAATAGAVALLSYAPATLDSDLAAARSHLTGDFLTYYSQFADQFVAPAAKDRGITATATVVRAAAVAVQPDSAEVLVFVDQETTSRATAAPVRGASSVTVGLTRVDGNWLISSFDPI